MDVFIIRIVEKLMAVYFLAYLVIDLGLFFYAARVFLFLPRRTQPQSFDYKEYPVSLLVPAYNEEVSIVDCIRMLLKVDYPDFEIIVINDGSKDSTMAKLMAEFNVSSLVSPYTTPLKTCNLRDVYITDDKRLIIIDKENGGKADAINAGLNFSTKPFICTIDADSILDNDALKEVIKPFIVSPGTMVSGGQLAASNDTIIRDNKLVSSRRPRNIWVLWQITEYIKSFMVSRIGLARINALLIMSGAFSMYRREDLLKVGGFLSRLNDNPYITKTLGSGRQTVCEDMEIVVRLFRYRRENRLKTNIAFLPEPICWTEVPDNGRNLFRQRSRWHQGLAETLWLHRDMTFEPRYGVTGLVGLPYYMLFELISPVVKIFTLAFIVFSAIAGLIQYQWFLLLLMSVVLLTTIIISAITVMLENWSEKKSAANRDALRFKTFGDWLWLISVAIIGEFTYALIKIVAQNQGMVNFARNKSDWKKFERKGIKKT